jgi:hypothetical protein
VLRDLASTPSSHNHPELIISRFDTMAANALAMEAARAQKVIGLGTWKEKIPAL